MNIQIEPGVLRGAMDAPPSKSHAHRCLIAAALANEPTEIKGIGNSEDMQATIRCLRAMGAQIEDGVVTPPGKRRKSALLRCGESGTTLRLLLPVVGAMGIEARFLGTGRLPERPIAPLIAAMTEHGTMFDKNSLPFTISGKLASGQYNLPGNVSSQFISGLLLALPLLDSGSTIRLTAPLVSAGYVNMTLDTMEDFSVVAMEREEGYLVPGSQGYRSPGALTVEGDWSNAAFFLVAGALGGNVTLANLARDSKQPDRRIASLLKGFGARVISERSKVHVEKGVLHGTEVDVDEMPDLLPILAVVGALSSGTTRLTNAARLRLKESDRLESTCKMLRNLGGHVQELEDELVITGGTLHGGEVDTFGDHRIAMAAAIAATACTGPVTIQNANVVGKSYPAFYEALAALGGHCHVIDDR